MRQREGFEISALSELSDEQLFEIYEKAIMYNVEIEFIELLDEELKRRGLKAGQNVC